MKSRDNERQAVVLEPSLQGSTSIRGNLGRRRILLVDDNVDLLVVLGSALRLKGYDVMTAGNGRQAIDCARSEAVDVVVTDIIMPEKEGLETIMAFRRMNPETSVIAMSGGGQINAEEQLRLADKMGVIGTLRKPFSVHDLISVIESEFLSAA